MRKTIVRTLLLAGVVALLASGPALAEEEISTNPREDDSRSTRVDERNYRSSDVDLELVRLPDRPVTRRLLLRLIGVREVDLFLIEHFRTELKQLLIRG
jgi:hypothetical protein